MTEEQEERLKAWLLHQSSVAFDKHCAASTESFRSFYEGMSEAFCQAWEHIDKMKKEE